MWYFGLIFIIILAVVAIIGMINTRRTKVVINVEPQEEDKIDIITKVYYKGDMIKQWTKKTTFSKAEELAEKQRVEGKALIKIFKKIRN